jgi:hypothetical protein
MIKVVIPMDKIGVFRLRRLIRKEERWMSCSVLKDCLIPLYVLLATCYLSLGMPFERAK